MDYKELRENLLEDLNFLQKNKVSYQSICDFVNSKQIEFTLFKDFFTRFRSKDNFYRGKSKIEKLRLICTHTHEFRYMNQSREEHLKDQLIKLVEEASAEEYLAYTKINTKKDYDFSRLKKYFGTTHPAGLVVRKNLKHKQHYNWLLNIKDYGSDFRILGIELTAKFREYAIVQTNEYWKLCWVDKNTHILQFVYESINKQTYLIARNKERQWFIKDNIYVSDHYKRRPILVDSKTLQELTQDDNRINSKTLKNLIKKNEVGLSISFMKKLIQNSSNKKEKELIESISRDYHESLRMLNTNNINMSAFKAATENFKKQILAAGKLILEKK